MKIGIIGPTKLSSLEEMNKKAIEIIKGLSKIVAQSKNEIVLTPDEKSTSEFFAKKYLSYGGKKVYSVIPLDDKEFGYGWLNLELGENINCNTWRNQPEKLNEESEILLCLGYSAGGLAEIAYTKWFPKGKAKKPVYVIEELVSAELPKDSIKKVDVEYVSYKEFKLK